MISSKLSFIKNYLILTIIILFTLGCSVYDKNLDGKYVNVENFLYDYYVFDKKNSSFKYFYTDKTGRGKMFTDNSTLFLKTDSYYEYHNLDIGYLEYSDVWSGNDTLGIVSIDTLSFQKFKEKHPRLSLYFIGFTSGIGKVITNPRIILELKTENNFFKIDDLEDIIGEFKIIGIHSECLIKRGTNDCELFDKSFETKKYPLSFWSGPLIKLDLDSLINKDLSQYRFIRAIDSFESNKRFYFDGKTYEKIERLHD